MFCDVMILASILSDNYIYPYDINDRDNDRNDNRTEQNCAQSVDSFLPNSEVDTKALGVYSSTRASMIPLSIQSKLVLT